MLPKELENIFEEYTQIAFHFIDKSNRKREFGALTPLCVNEEYSIKESLSKFNYSFS
jgi:hypothetical protein